MGSTYLTKATLGPINFYPFCARMGILIHSLRRPGQGCFSRRHTCQFLGINCTSASAVSPKSYAKGITLTSGVPRVVRRLVVCSMSTYSDRGHFLYSPTTIFLALKVYACASPSLSSVQRSQWSKNSNRTSRSSRLEKNQELFKF